jgi:hypothetical protein
MSGELHDWYYPKSGLIYNARKIECQHIMEFALAWILLYFCILKPFRVFERLGCPIQETNPRHRENFFDAGIEPRFPCFTTWRQYEQIHILFWLGKDYAWNTLDVPLWYICSICTLLIAIDFMFETSQQEGMGVEFTHYLSTFIWIIANMTWAIGELFYPARDYPYDLFSESSEAPLTARWYSAWILIFAIAPLLVLYIVWINATCEGKIEVRKHRATSGSEVEQAAGNTSQNPIWVNA